MSSGIRRWRRVGRDKECKEGKDETAERHTKDPDEEREREREKEWQEWVRQNRPAFLPGRVSCDGDDEDEQIGCRAALAMVELSPFYSIFRGLLANRPLPSVLRRY